MSAVYDQDAPARSGDAGLVHVAEIARAVVERVRRRHEDDAAQRRAREGDDA